MTTGEAGPATRQAHTTETAHSSSATAPDLAATSSMAALDRCVGDGRAFLRDHWGRVPLLHTGGSFTDLFGLTDVDHLVTSTLLRWPAFRMVRDGQQLEPGSYTRSTLLAWTRLDDVIDPGRILTEFHDGATIVLQGLHRYWPPLTRFCRELELVLTHPVQCNAYITPPGSRGLGIHYDTHDVLVLQTTGSKRWQVHERLVDHPLAWQRFEPDRLAGGRGQQEPELQVELEAGHCLYLPGGYLHQAVSTDQVSVHLTIGISPYTWADVIWETFRDASQEVTFREPLPAGFADDPTGLAEHIGQRLDLLRWWLETINRQELAERVVNRFWSTRTPLLAGQLEQLAGLEQVSDETLVSRRPESVVRLLPPMGDGDALRVLLGDRRLDMPVRLEPVMRLVVERPRFRVRDLSPFLHEDERVLLVRRLVREGLLEVVG